MAASPEQPEVVQESAQLCHFLPLVFLTSSGFFLEPLRKSGMFEFLQLLESGCT